MTEPYLSQLMLVSFSFAPKGWALCNGQLLAINQNQALFALLGTTYGGNGQTTFALPNLRGRAAMHMGAGYNQGEYLGSDSVTLNIQQLPTHNHESSGTNTVTVGAGGAANSTDPEGNYLATNPALDQRFRNSFDDQMGDVTPLSTASSGGSQPHENRMPYLVLNYVIALQGVFPSPN